jgi:hypothetical protein
MRICKSTTAKGAAPDFVIKSRISCAFFCSLTSASPKQAKVKKKPFKKTPPAEKKAPNKTSDEEDSEAVDSELELSVSLKKKRVKTEKISQNSLTS